MLKIRKESYVARATSGNKGEIENLCGIDKKIFF